MAIDEQGKVTFTTEEQAVVDKIVQERLARHKPEGYDELKEIEKELEDFGFKGSPAEKKEAIRAYKQQLKAQQELAELEEQAKTTGKDPELLKEIKSLKDEIAEIKGERQAQKQTEEQKKAANAAWQKQIQDFQESFPKVDLESLEKNEKFIDFVEGSGWTLKKGYEKFVKFYGEAEAEAILKVKSKEERSTSSGKGGSSDGGNYGLSDRQKELAQKAGMTAKEYAEYLKQIV